MLGALGKRELDDGDDGEERTTSLDAAEKPVVKRQAMRIIAQAMFIAAAGALVVYLL